MNSQEDQLELIQRQLRKHPPPQFARTILERRATRALLRQHAYAEELFELLQRDAFGSVIAFLKSEATKSFALSQRFLFWIVPPDPISNTPGVPFEEDAPLPADPWSDE